MSNEVTGSIRAIVSQAPWIVNDWVITTEETDVGCKLIARRGSEEQVMEVRHGESANPPELKVVPVEGGTRVTFTIDGVATSFELKDGKDAVTPSFSIGTVTTLEPEENADASISGTDEKPVLNLQIPRGKTGDPGKNGITPNISVSDIEGGHRVTIVTGDKVQSFDVEDGAGSWSDIEGKPFGNPITGTATIDGDTLKWDGDYANMPVFIGSKYNGWAYVSDNVPTADEMKSGYELYNMSAYGGNEIRINVAPTYSDNGNIYIGDIDGAYLRVVAVPDETYTRAGVYFNYNIYAHVTRLKINGFTWTESEEISPIPDKYIPDTVARREQVDALDARVGGMFETTSGITWDGNTEDRVMAESISVDGEVVRVYNGFLSADKLCSGGYTVRNSNGDSVTLTEAEARATMSTLYEDPSYGPLVFRVMAGEVGDFYICNLYSAEIQGLVNFPDKGVYFVKNTDGRYITKLESAGITELTQKTLIKESILPEFSKLELADDLKTAGAAADAKLTGEAIGKNKAVLEAVTEVVSTENGEANMVREDALPKIPWLKIKDAPVGDFESDTLTWDGVVTDESNVKSLYCWVSDVVLTADDLRKGYTVKGIKNGEPYETVLESGQNLEVKYELVMFDGGLSISAKGVEDNPTYGPTFNKPGTYFAYGRQGTRPDGSDDYRTNLSLQINGYNGFIERRKLDKKYLPDDVGGSRIQSDWNQNDDTQPDYIKNRPFWPAWSPVLLNEDVEVYEGTVEHMLPPGTSAAPTDGKRYTFGTASKTYSGIAVRDTFEFAEEMIPGIMIADEQGSGAFVLYVDLMGAVGWMGILPDLADVAGDVVRVVIIEGDNLYNKLSVPEDVIASNEGMNIVYIFDDFDQFQALLAGEWEIIADVNGVETVYTNDSFELDTSGENIPGPLIMADGHMVAAIMEDEVANQYALMLLDENAMAGTGFTTKSIEVNIPGIFAPVVEAKKIPAECLPDGVGNVTYYVNVMNPGDVYLYRDSGFTSKVTRAEFANAIGNSLVSLAGVIDGVVMMRVSPVICSTLAEYAIITAVASVIDGEATYMSWYTEEYTG